MKRLLTVFAALAAAVASAAMEIVPHAQVTGTGDDDTRWTSEPFAIEASTPYVFSCEMRHPEGRDTGVAVAMVADVSMYKRPKGNEWFTFTNAFATAVGKTRGRCALRQWHIPGVFEFRNVRVMKATPRYRRVADVELGFGEQMDGDMYRFGTRFGSDAHILSRPLVNYQSLEPNSTISLGAKSRLDFAHDLGGRTFLSGQVGLAIDGGGGRKAVLSLSRDGQAWTEVLAVSNIGAHRVAIPAALLPAKKLFARVSAGEGAKSVKLRQYSFDARVDGAPAFCFGATDYLDAESGATLLTVKPWDYLSDETSGAVFDGAPKGFTCWAQSSGRKVFRGRPAPTAKAASLQIAAARNEEEAAQLVVRPDHVVKGVKVTAEGLDAIDMEIRRVGYVLVDIPMDRMGSRGLWPDPIFGQDAHGCDIAAGENQPFWITAKPRKDAKAGVHKGRIKVSAADGTAFSVPLEVRVFDFDFPERMTCETAFGLSFGTVFSYQHATRKEDKAAITAKYLEMFARHHISPYSPMSGVSAGAWTDKWSKPSDPADAQPSFSWDTWDAAIEKALDNYHFNTFNLSIKGKGSSDPASRRPRTVRKINRVSETNALYEVYMERYLKAVEAHIREKGWLDRAYIYSFDEPLREDYDYVKEDLLRIKKYAPSLRRMVTEEPQEELYGAVNLWCPITEAYDRERAWARQAAGDQVWWYITFSSKPPKVNEHIEHAGVDMRVWLWQTWLERVTGVLIWETACWNRQAVYPDPERPQNPYEDAIVWARERPWNSGEGRYVYPPPRCFETKEPVIEGPVDSIRFEMLREGIEDYEYFAILKRLDPSNARLAVPSDVTTSLDDYSTDPAAMERHRVRLAEAIEQATKRKKADK